MEHCGSALQMREEAVARYNMKNATNGEAASSRRRNVQFMVLETLERHLQSICSTNQESTKVCEF